MATVLDYHSNIIYMVTTVLDYSFDGYRIGTNIIVVGERKLVVHEVTILLYFFLIMKKINMKFSSIKHPIILIYHILLLLLTLCK